LDDAESFDLGRKDDGFQVAVAFEECLELGEQLAHLLGVSAFALKDDSDVDDEFFNGNLVGGVADVVLAFLQGIGQWARACKFRVN
jgi:hypothetical protein